jgi:hypothetical protein
MAPEDEPLSCNFNMFVDAKPVPTTWMLQACPSVQAKSLVTGPSIVNVPTRMLKCESTVGPGAWPQHTLKVLPWGPSVSVESSYTSSDAESVTCFVAWSPPVKSAVAAFPHASVNFTSFSLERPVPLS